MMFQQQEAGMACTKKVLSIIIMGLALAVTASSAHETDQFTLPDGRPFADLGRHMNEWAYATIERGVNKVNARLAQQSRRGGAALDLTTPEARDEIVRAVNAEFGSAFDVIEGLERLLNSSQFMRKYPGQITGYKQNLGNIYQHVHFPLDPRQFFRLFQASTFMAYGTYLGTDKVGHFTDMGMHYYRAYSGAIKKGESEETAFAAAVKIGTDHGIFGEKGMVGYGSAGDYSNADLAANFLGLLFYLNLTDPVKIKGEMRPAMLTRERDGWKITPHVRPDSDFFSMFISDHFDEGLNPGLFEKSMRSAIREAVAERSASILNRRCDAHGNRRSKEFFDAVLKDCRTYYGQHYGHDGDDDELISIGNACFDPLPADAAASRRNSWGLTPLHLAAAQGDLNTVKRLVQEGAHVNVQVESAEPYSPEWGNTPLHYAARDGRREVAEHLIASGAKVNIANRRGVTPLHRALAYKDFAALLIENGAEVNTADVRGETPLHWAAQDGQVDAVELLLLREAGVRVRNNAGMTPLHLAARSGSAGAMTKLLAYGGEVNAADNLGMTALHFAAAAGNEAMIDLLLTHSADLNINDQLHWTPLHEAVKNGHQEIASLLLTRGASPAAADIQGNAPLHIAARHRREALAALLLERGSAIDPRNRAGETPLHYAAIRGDAAIVKLLLDRGAQADLQNNNGQNPAQLASSHRHKQVAAMLQNRARPAQPQRH